MNEISLEMQDNTAFIYLNDETALNCLTLETLHLLDECVNRLESDISVNIIVIKSSIDGIFSSGYDLNYLNKFNQVEAKNFSKQGQKLIKRIRDIKKTVISVVNGQALGSGFELLLASDFIFATAKSEFGFPEVNYGIIPGFGGLQIILRQLGESLTKYLAFTGEKIDVAELYNRGVVTKIFTTNKELDNFLTDFIKAFSEKSLFAIGLAKETINRGLEVDIESALLIEQNAFSVSFSSEDKKEGMKAFLEKRKPIFSDRWENFEDI